MIKYFSFYKLKILVWSFHYMKVKYELVWRKKFWVCSPINILFSYCKPKNSAKPHFILTNKKNSAYGRLSPGCRMMIHFNWIYFWNKQIISIFILPKCHLICHLSRDKICKFNGELLTLCCCIVLYKGSPARYILEILYLYCGERRVKYSLCSRTLARKL